MKKPLKVGDFVKAYGSPPGCTSTSYYGDVGRVIGLADRHVEVCMSDGNWNFFRQQVRRVIKKPRREIWVNEYKSDMSDVKHLGSICHTFKDAQTHKDNPGYIRTIHFVEKRDKK